MLDESLIINFMRLFLFKIILDKYLIVRYSVNVTGNVTHSKKGAK